MEKNKLIDWKIISAGIWLIFTVSLASWWMSLGLKYAASKKSMIIGEGLTLIVFLSLGGVALIYYILQERKRLNQVNEFFACANHELKTYMASLRLRAEALSEDLNDDQRSDDAQKIVRDTIRLELQIENSLIFSSPDNGQVYFESIDLKSYLEHLSLFWTNCKLIIKGNHNIQADKRMLDIIIKNIIQNAIVHGKATEINFDLSNDQIIKITNNGDAFKGDLKRLGEMFYRHQHQSRSGIGLYLVKKLMHTLKGEALFSLNSKNGLEIQLSFGSCA